MKKLLTALALTTALITPAFAEMGGDGVPVNSMFHCTITEQTPAEKSRDPITDIMVLTPHIRPEDGALYGMKIGHFSASGKAYYRADQYDTTAPGSIVSDPGKLGVIWVGTRIGRPELRMAGMLYKQDDNRWHYMEKLWRSGKPIMEMMSLCEPVTQ